MSLTIHQIESIASDVSYLRDEFRNKLSGDIDGYVTLENIIKFLEGDDFNNIHLMEHIIAVVKKKNQL